MNQVYLDTARLLTQVAPLVFEGDIFALKGGTAINLFVRDMPRLFVDLDLVFVGPSLRPHAFDLATIPKARSTVAAWVKCGSSRDNRRSGFRLIHSSHWSPGQPVASKTARELQPPGRLSVAIHPKNRLLLGSPRSPPHYVAIRG